MLDGNMPDGKNISKNKFIFQPVKVLQNLLDFPRKLKF